MVDRRRMSDPPVSSIYPASPARASRSSSIFPYSLARPPTSYSQQSWVNPEFPAVTTDTRRVSRPLVESPFDGIAEEKEEQLEGETPLYARSDWDESNRSPVGTGASTYSRSSYAGLTTALPTSAYRSNTLGDIQEEEEFAMGEYADADADAGGRWGFGAEQMISSPGAMTATPRTAYSGDQGGQWATNGPTMSPRAMTSSSYTADDRGHDPTNQAQWVTNGLTMSPGAMTATPHQAVFGQTDLTMSPGAITPLIQDRAKYETLRRSTLPSILELEHLTRNKEDPFADPEGATQRKGYGQGTPTHIVRRSVEILPSPTSARSPRFLSPAAQEKLGRMSVATARYPHTASSRIQKAVVFNSDEKGLNLAKLPVKGVTGFKRFYLMWRPFIVAALSLISTLLLTISLQNNPGPVSRYVIVPSGGFVKSPSNIGDVGLGVNGWCPLNGLVVANLARFRA
jgi:hypothetical protein